MKKIITLFLSLSICLSLTGCSSSKQNKQLRVGVMGSIDALPLILAKDQGYFAKQGIELDLQIFSSAKDRDAALQAGQLDAVIADSVALSLYANAGIDMKIVTITTGRFSLVATEKSNINQPADLKNKKIAVSQNTMIDYLSELITLNAQLKVTDIEKVIIPAMPTRLEALSNNQVDAAILPAPFDEIAVSQGAHVVEVFENKDIMLSQLAFTTTFLETNPNTIDLFLKAYDQGVAYILNTNISEYEDLLISVAGYSKESKGHIVLPLFTTHIKPSAEKLQAVIDWAYTKQLISEKIDAKTLIFE